MVLPLKPNGTPSAYHRWESFTPYRNSDGTWHILCVSGDGGFIIADKIEGDDEAEWIARALTAAMQRDRAGAAGAK